jgi:hypothetical protein
MAGTTPLSLVQQFDSTGTPLAGGLLSFFVAGTVATPQNAFADFGLTTPLSNPLVLDESGRVPQHWLADGLIHIRLTDSAGTPQVDTTMQVLGPSSGGGGGGGTVDPTAIIATGDIKARYGTGPLAGFVRLNGLTIGNATSGSTERANADTQALFVYLYTADTNLVVSGGRTGNALNDYNANKQLTLPDWRGRALAALDDMGNSAAGRLTATYFGTTTTVLGAASTTLDHTALALGNLPPYTPSGSVILGQAPNPSNLAANTASIGFVQVASGLGFLVPTAINAWGNSPTLAITGNAQGGTSIPFSSVQPTMLATLYLKL